MSFTLSFVRFARQLAPNVTADWAVHVPGGEGYAQAASQAFPFFRVAADGRYSSRTLMRLHDVSDTDESPVSRPVILTAGAPFSYDEDTEVKRGGLIGMCVWWAGTDGRCLLAVASGARRQHVGTAMLRFIELYMDGWGNPTLWVGRGNVEAQHFLLSLGFQPTAINSNGAICYAGARPDDGEPEPTNRVGSRPSRNSPWVGDPTPAYVIFNEDDDVVHTGVDDAWR